MLQICHWFLIVVCILSIANSVFNPTQKLSSSRVRVKQSCRYWGGMGDQPWFWQISNPIKIKGADYAPPPPRIFRPSYGPVKQSQVEDGKLQQVVFWSWPNKTVASNAWAIPQKLEFSVNPITYLFSGWSFLMIIALYRLFLPSKTQFGQKDIALPEKAL